MAFLLQTLFESFGVVLVDTTADILEVGNTFGYCLHTGVLGGKTTRQSSGLAVHAGNPYQTLSYVENISISIFTYIHTYIINLGVVKDKGKY